MKTSIRATIATVLAASALMGCARLQTLGRVTDLGEVTDTKTTHKDGTEVEEFPTGRVKAIHLDAQQRLVIASAKRYCAEPSPDALASYAASLGLGASAPGKGAASIAQALQSNAGSIGLRTQSITLMRDALYRMCEAANNGHLTDLQVALFLRRSQDLTAVVLAIEQLTGAVAANQVALTGSAESSATANLLGNKQAVEAAEQQRKAAEEKLEDLKTKVTEADAALEKAEDDAAKESAAYEAALKNDPDENDPNTIEARKKSANAKETQEKAEQDRMTVAGERDQAEKNLEAAENLKVALEAVRDAAITNARAKTGGSASFSQPVQVNELDKEASIAIAESVRDMVTHALDKSYTVDHCMDYLVNKIELDKDIAELCFDILRRIADKEIGSSFLSNRLADPEDGSGDKIRSMVEQGEIEKEAVEKFIADEGLGVRYPNFVWAAKYKEMRKKFLRELADEKKSPAEEDPVEEEQDANEGELPAEVPENSPSEPEPGNGPTAEEGEHAR